MGEQANNDRRRRLSAVMFTDMVGYSSMIQENEALGLELLEEHRGIVRAILAKHDGREIDTAGDAFFAEFSSALGATECAIEIQQAFHDRNLEKDAKRRIVLRIGLHLGDVVHQGDQVQGDGVNIAARMEPLARPGSICLSEDIARQVHNKIAYPVVPIGDRRLKNIRLPMVPYRLILPWEADFNTTRSTESFSRGEKERGVRLLLWSIPRPAWIGAALVTVAVAWFALSPLPSVDSDRESHPASVVAVLPFTVQGSPDFLYLGTGMVDLLSTKLDGVAEIRAVDPRAVLGIVAQTGQSNIDPSQGRRIADRLGAGSFVLGSIVEVGGRLRINAAVYPPHSDAPSEHGTSDGEADGIFDLVDRLAAQLITVDDRGPGAPVQGLEERTTTSFTALKHYLAGVRAFRSARFQVAADELTQAISIDSTFALAWYQLSATAEWLFDPDLIVTAAEQARKYADRLPERGRQLVEALYAGKLGRNREALQLYRDLLTAYPDDVEGWYQMAELQFHTGPSTGTLPEESLTAWERLIYFEPNQVTALIHMARIYAATGRSALVDSVARRVIELEPEADRSVELHCLLAFAHGLAPIPASLDRRLRSASDDVLFEAAWSLGAFRPSYEYPATIIPYLTETTRSATTRQYGYLMQAYLDIAKGRINSANERLRMAEADGFESGPVHRAMMALLPFREVGNSSLLAARTELEGWAAPAPLPSDRRSSWIAAHDQMNRELKLYLLGLLHARLGDDGAALQSASTLENTVMSKPHGSLTSDLALGIRAEVAIMRNDNDDATDLLASRAHDVWYQYLTNSSFAAESRERFVLGQLLAQSDRFQESIDEMRLFEGYSLYDWIYIAPSHLERAKALEAIGDDSGAADHYTRFLDLWPDPDPEFEKDLRFARQKLDELR